MTSTLPGQTKAASTPGICAWAYFNGELVPFEQATVSVATHALNYGTALFEGIRAYRQHDGGMAILFASEHYERLRRNARLLCASFTESVPELVEITRELLRRHGTAEDVYVRPLLYKSAYTIHLQLTGLEDRLAIYAFPMGDYVPTTGLRVSISAWQRVNDNAIPARGKISGSYVNACMAVEDARSGGFEETILLASDGHVAEASGANVFVVQNGELATPPLADDVLPGITREAVIRIAREAGYVVHERSIDRTELYLADEIFFTGTGAQVAPVTAVDGRPVGDETSPIAGDLQQRYFAAVRGQDERYASWLTPVER
jgi:branched-chain amino acid aminotransferase